VIGGEAGAPAPPHAQGRRGAGARTPAEARSFAATLLAMLDRAPADERLERLADALLNLT
jgi:hypothetical protein